MYLAQLIPEGQQRPSGLPLDPFDMTFPLPNFLEHFLTLRRSAFQALGTCIFLSSALESACFPRNPGSVWWRMSSRIPDGALGVSLLFRCGCSAHVGTLPARVAALRLSALSPVPSSGLIRAPCSHHVACGVFSLKVSSPLPL